MLLQAKEISYSLPILKHSPSVTSKYASIGEGSVIFPCSVVEAIARVGCGSIITANTTINHDAIINHGCLMYSNSIIRPMTVIGCNTKIGSGWTISFGTSNKEESEIKDGSTIESSF